MEGRITLGDIRVRCRFPISGVQKCRIRSAYGEHTQAELICRVKPGEAQAVLTDFSEEGVEISAAYRDGREEVLFCGILEEAVLAEEGGSAMLQLDAVSATRKMDVERKSRSFQDMSGTYRDVAEAVSGEYGAEVSWEAPDKRLTHPLIQYKETDYAFLKRILSHLGAGIQPESLQGRVSFRAGIKGRQGCQKITLSDYDHRQILYEDGGIRPAYEKRAGYEIRDMERMMRAGDRVQAGGRTYFVMMAETTFDGDMFCCTCRIFPEQCFEPEKMPLGRLRGIMLTGRVLETDCETVKLHLDIDRTQRKDGAYAFPWRPLTGNLLYCMPEEGTKAGLYFGTEWEESGAAICSIHENDESCRDMEDCNNRCLTTAKGKKLYLNRAEMGLADAEGQAGSVTWKDNSGLSLQTEKKISVSAKGRVVLRGKKVLACGKKEAVLARRDILLPAIVSLCGDFDIVGDIGSFGSSGQGGGKNCGKQAETEIEERYELGRDVLAVFSNIPAVGTGNPVLERIAAGMPFISRF